MQRMSQSYHAVSHRCRVVSCRVCSYEVHYDGLAVAFHQPTHVLQPMQHEPVSESSYTCDSTFLCHICSRHCIFSRSSALCHPEAKDSLYTRDQKSHLQPWSSPQSRVVMQGPFQVRTCAEVSARTCRTNVSYGHIAEI
jgi:hypothetical protein